MKEFNLELPQDNTVRVTNSFTNEVLDITERQLKYLQVLVAKGELDAFCFMIDSKVYHEDIDNHLIEPVYLFNSDGSMNGNIYNMDLETVLHQTSALVLEYIQLKRR